MRACSPRRWADNVFAIGADAMALVQQAHHIGRHSLVVGRANPARDLILDSLSSRAGTVTTVTAGSFPGCDLDGVGHIVLDYSSLPGASAFAVLRAILDLERAGRFVGELQVFSCETSRFRRADGGRAAALMRKDEHAADDMAPLRQHLCLWVPILSEGCGEDLAALYSRLQPDDVCPVLPFPARNARRGDDLVLEHRKFLFDQMHVEERDLIYAHERNPFDIYRTLATLHERRLELFDALESSQVIVTPTEASLLALGAFLASYEFGLPLAWPGRRLAQRAATARALSVGEQDCITCAWLAGSPYAPSAEPRL